MQDAVLFFRHTALGCFRRRRRYPVLSENWLHEADDARRFIRAYRDNRHDYSPDERRKGSEYFDFIKRKMPPLGLRLFVEPSRNG
jgi:hypothetical protein